MVIKDPSKPEPCCFSKKRALESTSNSGRDGAILFLVLKENFAVAPRTHGAVCRSCYYSVFWLPKLAPQTSFPRVRFASWKGPIQEAHFSTSAYQHHISFPNQKHFSKTLHPPDVTCGKIHKKIGKHSQRYCTFTL